MLRRIFVLLAAVAVGMAAGYLLWGSRLGNLTEALNRMVFEDDALRTRLATSIDSSDLENLVEQLAVEVKLQGRVLDEQLALLEELKADSDGDEAVELMAARAERERMAAWLQSCLSRPGRGGNGRPSAPPTGASAHGHGEKNSAGLQQHKDSRSPAPQPLPPGTAP